MTLLELIPAVDALSMTEQATLFKALQRKFSKIATIKQKTLVHSDQQEAETISVDDFLAEILPKHAVIWEELAKR
ncbi:MAG: hypothetical protein KGS46_18790 [Chloroflexi bacterium]|jgi:hypothetical protein|nr:hypothetical protein [Chloroflexota bacterium]